MEEILGINPILLTAIMVIASVGITNTLGWLKSKGPVQPKRIAASAIIGCIAGFSIIMPTISALLQNPSTDEYSQFTAIVIGILGLVGADTLIKNVGNSIRK